MSAAYLTWDEAIEAGHITDDADGWPDTHMVPLVEHLRIRGVVTLQSCQGHRGTDDGCLWIDPTSVADGSAEALIGAPFSLVRRTRWPEERWEFWWHPSDRNAALAALNRLESATPRWRSDPVALERRAMDLVALWESMAGPSNSVYEACASDLRGAVAGAVRATTQPPEPTPTTDQEAS